MYIYIYIHTYVQADDLVSGSNSHFWAYNVTLSMKGCYESTLVAWIC